MINRDELVQIGQFKKPHGLKGEITFLFTYIMEGLARRPLFNDILAIDKCPFLICEIEGIFVPFHIKDYRFISNSMAYVILKGIDSDQRARALFNKNVFFPAEYILEDTEDDSFTWNSFIGFTLTDERLGEIGCIVDVDKTTINTLFIVEKDNEEILIPAVEEFIICIDEDQKEVVVALPDGLIEQ